LDLLLFTLFHETPFANGIPSRFTASPAGSASGLWARIRAIGGVGGICHFVFFLIILYWNPVQNKIQVFINSR
jgi:hypothetical protein